MHVNVGKLVSYVQLEEKNLQPAKKVINCFFTKMKHIGQVDQIRKDERKAAESVFFNPNIMLKRS